MAECGKGCMPECEYFTSAGCISPFNCMYKEESGYINSATSGSIIYTGRMNMTNEEMIENLKCVIADISKQCEELQAENAALRERLEEAVNKRVVANMLAKYFGCPCNFSLIDEEMYEFCDSCAMNDVDCWEKVIEKNIAEACLKELKEKNND